MFIFVIFVYFILASLLPIDKLVGRLYPVFGFALLFMAVGILIVLISSKLEFIPEFSTGLQNRFVNPETNRMFPLMFVSIACGAISGFHATQTPMMARCLKNEKYSRPVFYGAMVAEGIVALIWAAAAIAFFKTVQFKQSCIIRSKVVSSSKATGQLQQAGRQKQGWNPLLPDAEDCFL